MTATVLKRRGRWQVLCYPTAWRRGHGRWPHYMNGDTRLTLPPIFRWWRLGPVEVRRFDRRTQGRR